MLQVARGSATVGCPSFIIRSVFMEQAGKLNIAAQWAQAHSGKNKTSLVVVADDKYR